MNFIISVLSQFRTKLLAANHLITRDRTKFDTEQKSSKFLLEIITPVSSANTGSDTKFILRGRSFIYIYILWTVQALELIPGEFHISMNPSHRKNSELN